MKQNVDRILTTHTGSLPRGRELTALYANRQKGEAVDAAAIARLGRDSMRQVVAKQAAAGIDIGNDGEQMKDGFFLYLKHRLTGLGGSWQRSPRADVERYPEFKRMLAEQAAKVAVNARSWFPKAVGEVKIHQRRAAARGLPLLQGDAGAERPSLRRGFPDRPLPGDRRDRHPQRILRQPERLSRGARPRAAN